MELHPLKNKNSGMECKNSKMYSIGCKFYKPLLSLGGVQIFCSSSPPFFLRQSEKGNISVDNTWKFENKETATAQDGRHWNMLRRLQVVCWKNIPVLSTSIRSCIALRLCYEIGCLLLVGNSVLLDESIILNCVGYSFRFYKQ